MTDSVARGVAINFANRLLAVALVLSITALTARLGTDKQGAFSLFTSVEGVMLALLSGFGVAVARRISHHAEPPRQLLAAVAVACVAIGALLGIAVGLVSRFGPPAYGKLWLLALAAPLLLLAPNLAGVWLGEGRMAPLAAVALGPPLLTFGGLLLLWSLQAATLTQVLVAWVLAKVAVALTVLVVLWRSGRLGRPRLATLRGDVSFIAIIGMTNLIGLLNYRVGLFVIERLLGLSATGVYSIAVVAAELLWFVSGSLTQAVYSRIGTPDRARAASTTLRAVHLSLTALLLGAPLLWLAARIAIPWLLGPAYAASPGLLMLLLPGVLVFGAASALSAYFTNHAGRPQLPARVAGLSLALNAILALLLVPRLGMAGAALAASISYAVAVFVLAFCFARHAGLPLAEVLLPGARWRADLRGLVPRRGAG